MTVPAHVVVADDDEDIRLLVGMILSAAGLRTTECGNGQSVLDASGHDDAALYVLDVRMPELSGLDLCRTLRARPHTSNTPILLISAEASLDDVQAGLSAGATDYLPKPFSRRELLRRVNQLLATNPDVASTDSGWRLRPLSELRNLPDNADGNRRF